MTHQPTNVRTYPYCPPTTRWQTRFRSLLAPVAMMALAALPAMAQSTDALAQKDAEIAALKAEIAQLKAAQAPAPEAPVTAAPATTTTTVTTAAPVETAAQSQASQDQVLQMSAFEVRTTAGEGYSAGNSASALKTSDSLMELPAQIVVVTSDMIHDIGSHVSSDVLAMAGLVPYYRGPAIMSRGNRIGNPYIDDAPQGTGIGLSDNTNIDTYEVIKGPEQVMYPLASLGGVVLEVTKKPLPHVTQYILDETVEQWGKQTFTFDLNQPIGELGAATVTSRVEGIAQTGQGPFYNVHDDKWAIYPNVELDWKETNLVLEYDAVVQQYLPGGTGILTPDGGLYTGLGRRNMNTPPGDYDHFEEHDMRIEWTQRFSDQWQAKTQGTFFNSARGDSSAGYPSTVNWNNDTITYTIREDNGWNAADLVQSDIHGKYEIYGIPMTTSFGFNIQDAVSISKFLFLPTPLLPTIPIGNAAAINSITFPPVASYTGPQNPNPGQRTETTTSNGYFSQTVDAIPKWLTLVGGFTFSKIETVGDTNIAIKGPYIATDANNHQLLHRIAALVHVGKEITAYFCESSTFSPGVGVDYNNVPLPNVLGVDDEFGAKASFLDGKLSASAALFKMELTNQAILAPYPLVNVANTNYYILYGNSNTKGWDGSVALAPFPGLQFIGTVYIGTVHDQNNNPVAATVENSWSIFTRYDFPSYSLLKGWAVGVGSYKAGGKWFNMAGLVLPNNAPLPKNSSGNSIFKLKQDVIFNPFVDYVYSKHLDIRLSCENILNAAFPIGAQGVGLVDPVDPTTLSLEVTLKY